MKLVIVFCSIVLASSCSAQNEPEPDTTTTSKTSEDNPERVVTESASKTSEKSTK